MKKEGMQDLLDCVEQDIQQTVEVGRITGIHIENGGWFADGRNHLPDPEKIALRDALRDSLEEA